MAYLLQLFGRSGEPVVQRAAPVLLEAASRLDPDLFAIHEHDGVGTAGYEVFSRRDRDGDARVATSWSGPGIDLSIFTGLKPADMSRYISQGGPAQLAQCDTQISLTLAGGPLTDATWTTVRAVCRAATDLWDAVLCDEVDGFAVTIDDI
jgi:hypothetical protein